ncbi:DUF1801 domain-containing protein [Pedobacter sp. Leaf176]|uniref:DUF1801 domain-containing protein n=1 Tax=Pedobacter sp. Leaf176 TaxID=1736286 RepID=UPI0007022B13|nr:DUF1801 domain-containing protein [Pedobacter sp. Leaf176]KQR72508.1 hypothetical protein ASF92_04310 [Pedobacter sp. Leaf176]
MAYNKTTENDNSVAAFLNTVADEIKRKDGFELLKLFEEASYFKAKMWGTAIIGFGSYHYKYESGRESNAPLTGFSPRKDSFALYFSSELKNKAQLLYSLGKHKTGKACVYIKTLEDINKEILKQMIINSIDDIKSRHP